MTENKTEALKKKLDEEKAEKEAQRLKEEKLKAEQEAKQVPKKAVLPVWLPYLAAAVVAFVISLFLKNTAINTIICIGLGVLAFVLLEQLRKKQLSEANVISAEQFSSDIAAKLYELQDLLIDRAKGVKKAEVRETLGSIAGARPQGQEQGKKTCQLLWRHASGACGQVYQTPGQQGAVHRRRVCR